MKTFLTIAALIVSMVGGAGVAPASPDRITKGEAQAVLHARGTGGGAIHNNGHGKGAPADPDFQVAIRPYYEDGLHYCVDDWHAITLALITDGLPRGEAAAALDASTMTFVLDGVALDTERGPVKRFLDQEFVDGVGYFFAQGRLIAPGELTVGSHTQVVTVNDPSNPAGPEVLTSQFFMDASGTGACV